MAIQPKNDTAIKADTITEKTASAGVTVEGVLIRDNYVLLDNAEYLRGRDSGSTARDLLGVNASDELDFNVTQDLDWDNWVPTIAGGGSMTWTTTTTNKARYTQIGDMVWFEIDITGTTSGTAASSVTFTLPSTALDANYCWAAGVIDTGISSGIIGGFARSSSTTVVTVFNEGRASWTLAAGQRFRVIGNYRAA